MYGVIIKNVKITMPKFKTLRERKKQNKGWFRSGSLVNIISYTYKGRMIQFKYKYLKINGDVNITGNRRALHSESKCFFFSIMGIFHKTLNLALEVLDQSQGSLDYYSS